VNAGGVNGIQSETGNRIRRSARSEETGTKQLSDRLAEGASGEIFVQLEFAVILRPGVGSLTCQSDLPSLNSPSYLVPSGHV
jgi:hypothetical protein